MHFISERRADGRVIRPRSVALLTCAALLAAPASSARGQARWRVDPSPATDIVIASSGGGAAGDIRTAGAVRLSDGSLVVADAASGRLARFDKASVDLRRSGGAPGPTPWARDVPVMNRLAWMGRCGPEAVATWDPADMRAMMLTERVAEVRQIIVAPDRRYGAPHSLVCNDSVLAYQATVSGTDVAASGSEFIRGTAPVFVVGTNGEQRARINGIPTDELIRIGRGVVPGPLGERTLIVLTRDRLLIATTDSGVTAYTFDGHQLGAFRVEADGGPPTAADYRAAEEEILRSVPQSVAPMIRGELMRVPRSRRTLPPFRAVISDTDGLLWFVTSPVGAKTRMKVLDAMGKHVADVALEIPFTPTDIGREFILGTYEGSEGATHLAVLRLTRSPR